jgi:hypothetical protein
MEGKETILKRIQKLFALAGNNPSEKEAYAAMLKAQELLLEHGLSMEQVNGFEEEEKADSSIKEDSVEQGGGKLYGWQTVVMRVITKNFRCKWFVDRDNGRITKKGTYRNDKKLMLFGQAKDVDAARETINFIFKVAPALWKQFYKTWSEIPGNFTFNKSQTYAMKNDYFAGFAKGLEDKFIEQVQSKDLMIVIPDAVINSWEMRSRNFTSLKGSGFNRSYNDQAYGQGYRDGKGASEKHKYING